ncbi:MAG: hypothetical protein ABL907_22420 [Hyphomicrobium sp.]
MSIVEYKYSSSIINKLLSGMSLDSFRVYSAIILIGFIRSNSPGDLPTEAWISVSGALSVESLGSDLEESEDLNLKGDFFAARASVLGSLYRLIGGVVTTACVSPHKTLEIELGEKRICVHDDEDDFEEVWAVMSDSPDVNDTHQWYVALDDAGRINVRSPGSI